MTSLRGGHGGIWSGPGRREPVARRRGRAAWRYWALGRLQGGDVDAAGMWHLQRQSQIKGFVKPERAPKGAFWSLEVERAVRYAPFFSASSCLRICASTAAIAVMLSTRREVALVVRMCAGLATPIRIGPIATPSVNTRTRL